MICLRLLSIIIVKRVMKFDINISHFLLLVPCPMYVSHDMFASFSFRSCNFVADEVRWPFCYSVQLAFY
jgi:hypothetical protein